jgi:hypothetical protein
VIPSLQHRKQGGKEIVRVTLSENMAALATGDPVYVIDGVATKNTEFFLSLKPADVLTVKIITDPNKLTRFGMFGKNGIVTVQTRGGDAREPLDDPSRLIRGLNRAQAFHATDHSDARHTRLPDFRSTIFWNPYIKTDSNGKAMVEFFCSDDTGKLALRLDGFTVDRQPFSASKEITVTFGPDKN